MLRINLRGTMQFGWLMDELCTCHGRTRGTLKSWEHPAGPSSIGRGERSQCEGSGSGAAHPAAR